MFHLEEGTKKFQSHREVSSDDHLCPVPTTAHEFSHTRSPQAPRAIFRPAKASVGQNHSSTLTFPVPTQNADSSELLCVLYARQLKSSRVCSVSKAKAELLLLLLLAHWRSQWAWNAASAHMGEEARFWKTLEFWLGIFILLYMTPTMKVAARVR